MKNRFLVGLALSVAVVLSSGAPVFAQIGNVNIGNNLGDYQEQIQKKASLKCDIEASVVLVTNTVQNDLTFSLDYQSDEYVKQAAPYEIMATGKNNAVLYQKTGNFNLNGSGRVAVSGESAGPNGTTFRFNAKDHSEVKLTAKVDGKVCPEVKIQAKTNFSAQAVINAINDPSEIVLNNNIRSSSTVVVVPEGMDNSPSSTNTEINNEPVDQGTPVQENTNNGERTLTNDNNPAPSLNNQNEPNVSVDEQNQRDYILYGLLGTLIVIMITYIVMKKRGSI